MFSIKSLIGSLEGHQGTLHSIMIDCKDPDIATRLLWQIHYIEMLIHQAKEYAKNYSFLE